MLRTLEILDGTLIKDGSTGTWMIEYVKGRAGYLDGYPGLDSVPLVAAQVSDELVVGQEVKFFINEIPAYTLTTSGNPYPQHFAAMKTASIYYPSKNWDEIYSDFLADTKNNNMRHPKALLRWLRERYNEPQRKM
jgi:hypothetical protein